MGQSITPGTDKMNKPISDFDTCEALTVKAVAELLNVSQPTVRSYIRQGLLPSLELGGCRRILRSDLEAFLADHRCFGLRPLKSNMRLDEVSDIGDSEKIPF